MKRKATNYKLSEADHEVIKEALYKFVPVYVLAKKIGCGYHTLLDYIKRIPELRDCQKDAEDNMVSFAKGKLMQKVGAGHAASIMFLLERLDKEHFGRYTTVNNIGELPNIQIGMFNEGAFVEPVRPEDVGEDAATILANAAKMAEQKAAEAEAAEAAEMVKADSE